MVQPTRANPQGPGDLTYTLPLIGMGVMLLAAARRWRPLPLLILLAVPAYYLSVQSALHTEYRYILAIHYFLLVMAAVTLYCLGLGARQGIKGYGEAAGRRARRVATLFDGFAGRLLRSLPLPFHRLHRKDAENLEIAQRFKVKHYHPLLPAA